MFTKRLVCTSYSLVTALVRDYILYNDLLQYKHRILKD